MYTKTYWGSKRLPKHPLGPGISTIPNACNIYFYVYKATNWIIFKFMEIFFMPPKVLFSFPESTARKHQLLTATSFPDEFPSSELQLPSPRLATSPLNIEHNECAFFKQPFYTAPLKGTIWTNSKERMQAVPSLIEKRGSKTIPFPINFFTQIYKVDSWYGAHLPYKTLSFNLT